MDGRTWSTHGPICPYCAHEHTPDSPVFFADGSTVFECDNCQREFEMSVTVSTSWACEPISPPKDSQ